MPLPPSLIPCPVCGAVLAADTLQAGDHLYWHEQTGTLGRFSSRDVAAAEMDRGQGRTWHDLFPGAGDDAPTTRMPPVGATTRRRPPVPPAVRELRGRELLDELGRLLDAGVFEDDEEPAPRRGACGLCGRTVVELLLPGGPSWEHTSASDHQPVDVITDAR